MFTMYLLVGNSAAYIKTTISCGHEIHVWTVIYDISKYSSHVVQEQGQMDGIPVSVPGIYHWKKLLRDK